MDHFAFLNGYKLSRKMGPRFLRSIAFIHVLLLFTQYLSYLTIMCTTKSSVLLDMQFPENDFIFFGGW